MNKLIYRIITYLSILCCYSDFVYICNSSEIDTLKGLSTWITEDQQLWNSLEEIIQQKNVEEIQKWFSDNAQHVEQKDSDSTNYMKVNFFLINTETKKIEDQLNDLDRVYESGHSKVEPKKANHYSIYEMNQNEWQECKNEIGQEFPKNIKLIKSAEKSLQKLQDTGINPSSDLHSEFVLLCELLDKSEERLKPNGNADKLKKTLSFIKKTKEIIKKSNEEENYHLIVTMVSTNDCCSNCLLKLSGLLKGKTTIVYLGLKEFNRSRQGVTPLDPKEKLKSASLEGKIVTIENIESTEQVEPVEDTEMIEEPQSNTQSDPKKQKKTKTSVKKKRKIDPTSEKTKKKTTKPSQFTNDPESDSESYDSIEKKAKEGKKVVTEETKKSSNSQKLSDQHKTKEENIE